MDAVRKHKAGACFIDNTLCFLPFSQFARVLKEGYFYKSFSLH